MEIKFCFQTKTCTKPVLSSPLTVETLREIVCAFIMGDALFFCMLENRLYGFRSFRFRSDLLQISSIHRQSRQAAVICPLWISATYQCCGPAKLSGGPPFPTSLKCLLSPFTSKATDCTGSYLSTVLIPDQDVVTCEAAVSCIGIPPLKDRLS